MGCCCYAEAELLSCVTAVAGIDVQEHPYGQEAADGVEAMDLGAGTGQPCKRYTREELLERVQVIFVHLPPACVSVMWCLVHGYRCLPPMSAAFAAIRSLCGHISIDSFMHHSRVGLLRV